MPTATRTFRVFVSSTFEDLKAERDTLQRDVFPKLRKLCEEHGARFQAIDLRWGVRDEAALDQQTMNICLGEIERCKQTGIKPNFIVLLGDRYGWRPVPARIEAQEFTRVRNQTAETDQQLIDEWYEKDDNAEPPEFLLKPRTGELIDKQRWQHVEQALHGILRAAARAAGLLPELLIKYEASATHQEILQGLGDSEEDRRHIFAFFREASPGVKVDADLKALKEALSRKLPPGNIHAFQTGDFAQLCKDVEEQLSTVIKAETERFTSRPALDLEIEAHETFARSRILHFGGRQAILGSIEEYLRNTESRPLVIHGPSGCGKSAIVAKASAQAKERALGVVLIQRYIGATPGSSAGITLLQSLCEQLSRDYGVVEETPIGFQPLVVAFHGRIARASAERPLVVFLDALDQLRSDDEARSFTWLRQNLPSHVSLIVSTTEIPAGLQSAAKLTVEGLPLHEADEVLGAWLMDAGRRLQPQQRQKVLAEFAGSRLPLYLNLAFEEARRWRSFDSTERCALGSDVGGMIDALFSRLSEETNHGPTLVKRSLGFLAAARYGLTEDEMLDVLAADGDVWKDFESRARHEPPERRLPVVVWSRFYLEIEPYLNERAAPGGNVISFYHRQVADRAALRYLQQNDKALRYMALATYFGKQTYWQNRPTMEPNKRKITELVQHQISAGALTDLEATLTEIDFIAAKCAADLVVDLQLDYRDAIAALPEGQMALKEEAQKKAEVARWTKEIADYAQRWSQRRNRQMRGETIVEREPTLPEPVHAAGPWTDERIEHEAERIRTSPTRLDRLRAIQGFIQQQAHPLQQFGGRAEFVLQHAYNQAPSGAVHEAARRGSVTVRTPLFLRHWFSKEKYYPMPALLRTLENRTGRINTVAMIPNARRVVSAGDDNTLRVWNLETGSCLAVLEGHRLKVNSVSVTPDGRRAVSGSDDQTLRVWDLESGQCLHVLEGHSRAVTSVCVTPDGSRAVSGSNDATLRVWDLEVGTFLRVLEGHAKSVRSVSMTPDGRRALSGSDDATLRVWDLEKGASLCVLEGHTGPVYSVSLAPEGLLAVSASLDVEFPGRVLRIWDLELGICVRMLDGESIWDRSVSITPDGRLMVSGGMQSKIQVWDLKTGNKLRVLEGHTGPVISVHVTPDGRQAVSGGWDDTLRVWDLEMGKALPLLVQENHSSVQSVSGTPDGRIAVSVSPDSMRVWDLETGACLRVIKWSLDLNSGKYSCNVTSDGKHAFATDGNVLGLWNLETGLRLHTVGGFSGSFEPCAGLSVTPDHRIAAWGRGKDVEVVDIELGSNRGRLKGHTESVTSVSVTPDGRRAVSGSDDSTIRIWDLETGACLRKLELDGDRAISVCIGPDGQRAVTGNYNHSLHLWDLETGVCLRVLEGHTAPVGCVSVRDDGKQAVSASRDHTVRLWNLETGACLAAEHLPAPITSMAIAALPGRVIVGTAAGEVLQLSLHNNHWSSREISASNPPTSEDQLRREASACFRLRGESHLNTMLRTLGLAAVLDRVGKHHEASKFRRTVAKTCLSLDGQQLLTVREVIERLIKYLDFREERGLLLERSEELYDLYSPSIISFQSVRSDVANEATAPSPLQLQNSEDIALLLKLKSKLSADGS